MHQCLPPSSVNGWMDVPLYGSMLDGPCEEWILKCVDTHHGGKEREGAQLPGKKEKEGVEEGADERKLARTIVPRFIAGPHTKRMKRSKCTDPVVVG